jgi:hypothetical protein
LDGDCIAWSSLEYEDIDGERVGAAVVMTDGSFALVVAA